MPIHKVIWETTQDTDSMNEAVGMAWDDMRDPASTATFFTVVNEETHIGIHADFKEVIEGDVERDNPADITEIDERPIWEQLGFKNVWDIHPKYKSHHWQFTVRRIGTRLGYWEWVKAQLDAE